jgi:hypothetical protein
MRMSVHQEGVRAPGPSQVAATGSNHELAGADELIADLAALLDAGLVVVHEHVLGPPRYGVAPVAGRPAGRRPPRTPAPGRHHARVR